MLSVKVWADYACFTRPENKVERVSYDVMTPSAARGVLEAIFWKPQIRWQIREIWVLKPIKHYSILRNEGKKVAVAATAKKWAETGGGYDIEDDRTQRHSLILRHVEYIIKADIILQPNATDPIQKYQEMFKRRVERGQAYHMPYLGNREYTAYFSPVDGTEKPIDVTDDLGRMLLDMQYTQQKKGSMEYVEHNTLGKHIVSGTAKPRFFAAKLEQGILRIPESAYEGI